MDSVLITRARLDRQPQFVDEVLVAFEHGQMPDRRGSPLEFSKMMSTLSNLLRRIETTDAAITQNIK